MEYLFILIAYVFGSAFGWYYGKVNGMKQGIEDTVDNLIDQGYIKYKGARSDPEVMKWNEEK
tara:strand:+ start:340 stop:525 length:186 start_codon:yes stop_codon:yes gene_type:complete